MNRYKISFEYNGSDFWGSQIQKEGITVQGELIKALCTLTKNNKTKVVMAGRTDRGVSAYNQSAHFDFEDKVQDKNKFLLSLNALLPSGVRVFEIENVASFHAQKSATYRHYRYVINNNLISSPFDINVLHNRMQLNIERMNNCLNYILGEHDFSCFKSVSSNPYVDCIIYYANVRKDVYGYILIDIVGNRFLYNMVRAIVGTLFLIESKNLTQDYMEYVLNSKMRKNAGANVSPVGLTLIKTGYDNPEIYVDKLMKGIINENL